MGKEKLVRKEISCLVVWQVQDQESCPRDRDQDQDIGRQDQDHDKDTDLKAKTDTSKIGFRASWNHVRKENHLLARH